MMAMKRILCAWLGVLVCSSAFGVPINDAQFFDLTQVRLSENPAYQSALRMLDSTFQILELPEDAPAWSGDDHLALAPENEGGARLQASCTGTFLGRNLAVTARHCLRSKRGEHIELNHVLRRHLFRVENDHLVRYGYEDFRLSGAVVRVLGDLEIVELAPEDHPRAVSSIEPPPSGFDYPEQERFHAVGYPSSAYGVPMISVGCRIKSVPQSVLVLTQDHYLGVDCRLVGGMSGGPQFDAAQGFQIGINSMSGGTNYETLVLSPRLGRAL
jgi:V8-like Glu-specific endopeptidase